MTPNFSAPACMHPSPVAALALGPSGSCQRYQSPTQPPGPRRGGRLSAWSAQPRFSYRGLWARLLGVLGSFPLILGSERVRIWVIDRFQAQKWFIQIGLYIATSLS